MLNEINQAAEDFSKAMENLEKLHDQVEKDRIKALRKRSKKMQEWVEKAQEAAIVLEEISRDYPEMFEKPKTRIVNGTKFGFRNIPDTVNFDDANVTASLIKQHLGEKAETLVKYVPKISKVGLKNLSDKEKDLVDVYEVPGYETFVLSRPKSKDLKDFVELVENV